LAYSKLIPMCGLYSTCPFRMSASIYQVSSAWTTDSFWMLYQLNSGWTPLTLLWGCHMDSPGGNPFLDTFDRITYSTGPRSMEYSAWKLLYPTYRPYSPQILTDTVNSLRYGITSLYLSPRLPEVSWSRQAALILADSACNLFAKEIVLGKYGKGIFPRIKDNQNGRLGDKPWALFAPLLQLLLPAST